MVTLYNETTMDTTKNIVEQMVVINEITHHVLSSSVLVLVFFAVFFALKQTDVKSALFGSSLITTILSLIGLAMGLINEVELGIMIAVLVISLIVTIWRRE